MAVDDRQAARSRIADLIALLRPADDNAVAPILAECEALERAINAFHMEGIRFRIFNVDRLLRGYAARPERATALLEEARKHLEAAGFHTRSHKAPQTACLVEADGEGGCLLRDGRPVWKASHFRITADELSKALSN